VSGSYAGSGASLSAAGRESRNSTLWAITSSFWQRPVSLSHSSWCRRPSTATPRPFGEVVGAHLGLAAERDDVDEVRAAVLAVAVAATRHRELQLRDLGLAALAQLDVLGRASDHMHHLEVRVRSSVRVLIAALLRGC
jgi:hypothetical protein